MISPLFGYGTATLAHFPGQFPRANPVRVSQKQRRGRKPRARSRQRRPMAATGARVRGGGEGPRTPAPGTDAPRDQAKDAGREPRGRDTVRGDGGKETGGSDAGSDTGQFQGDGIASVARLGTLFPPDGYETIPVAIGQPVGRHFVTARGGGSFNFINYHHVFFSFFLRFVTHFCFLFHIFSNREK